VSAAEDSADDTATAASRLGTRWGRSTIAIGVGLAATAALGSMMWRGVAGFDSSVILQDASATFSSSEIDAQDVGFGMAPVTTVHGGQKAVLRAGFARASLDGLCVSKTESIGPLSVTVRLVAGDGTDAPDITAANAAFDISSLRADGNGVVLGGTDQIGLSTDDITTTPGGSPYDPNPLGGPTTGNGQGWTGIDASSGQLIRVAGTLWQAQIKGDVGLPNLRISVGHGNDCADDAAAGVYPK